MARNRFFLGLTFDWAFDFSGQGFCPLVLATIVKEQMPLMAGTRPPSGRFIVPHISGTSSGFVATLDWEHLNPSCPDFSGFALRLPNPLFY